MSSPVTYWDDNRVLTHVPEDPAAPVAKTLIWGEIEPRTVLIPRKMWDALTGPQHLAPVRELRGGVSFHPDAAAGRERCSSTSLETVQRILSRPRWAVDRDAADASIRENVCWNLRRGATSLTASVPDRYAVPGRAVVELGEPLDVTIADRLEQCGRWKGERECSACGRVEPKRWFCNLWHLCPTCARQRSKAMVNHLDRACGRLTRERGYRFKMVTVTVRTDGAWRESTATATKQFGRLVARVLRYRWRYLEPEQMGGKTLQERPGGGFLGRRRAWRCRKTPPGQAVGGVWVRETVAQRFAGFRSVEYGPESGNVHVHGLFYAAWVPQEVIAEEWERLSGACVVHIKEIAAGCAPGTEGFRTAIRECAKYVTKEDVPAALLIQLWRASRGRQMTQVYGAFRGLVPADSDLGVEPCPDCRSLRWYWRPIKPEHAHLLQRCQQ